MSKSTPDLAILVQVEEAYGIRRVVATVGQLTTDSFNTPSFYIFSPETHYDGMTASAYLSDDMVGAYGYHVGFSSSVPVYLAQMEAQVKVLRRVERGLERARAQFGYPDTFSDYVCHVAHALGITRFAVRNSPEGQAMSGSWVRHTDAAGVQTWVAEQVRRFTRATQAA